jgi:cytoskeletal protein CcmA (bactofilin family)
MFGKDPGSPGDGKLNSIIGKGSKTEGEIVVGGGLKIDGHFKGRIKADSVFVGKEAVIEATVDTNVAVIGGKVVGDVIARESLELQPKSELVGNVRTKNLVVGESAVLDGYCDMGQKDRHPKPPDKAGSAPGGGQPKGAGGGQSSPQATPPGGAKGGGPQQPNRPSK